MIVDCGYIFRQQNVGLVQISIAKKYCSIFSWLLTITLPRRLYDLSIVAATSESCTLIMSVYILNFLSSQSVGRSK